MQPDQRPWPVAVMALAVVLLAATVRAVGQVRLNSEGVTVGKLSERQISRKETRFSS